MTKESARGSVLLKLTRHMKHRAASLRQQSYLYSTLSTRVYIHKDTNQLIKSQKHYQKPHCPGERSDCRRLVAGSRTDILETRRPWCHQLAAGC